MSFLGGGSPEHELQCVGVHIGVPLSGETTKIRYAANVWATSASRMRSKTARRISLALADSIRIFHSNPNAAPLNWARAFAGLPL